MLIKKQPETVARVRYGEEEISTQNIFQSLDHDPSLIADLAILSAEIYYRYERKPAPDYIPTKQHTWEQFTDFDEPALPSGIWHVGGLGYEIWTTNYQGGTAAVLMFRGTRGLKGWEDWFANCRWLTKFIPFTWDQYDHTHHIAGPAVATLKQRFGDKLRIFSAGHSLGGGLAQHAGYSVQDIKTIYVFNTSPITGFYSLPKEDREHNAKQMRILRIYEHGEILAYFRLVMRFFYPISYRNPSITEVRFNFGQGDGIAQHNMEKFALGLKQIAAE